LVWQNRQPATTGRSNRSGTSLNAGERSQAFFWANQVIGDWVMTPPLRIRYDRACVPDPIA
jgi:hypothetical protein